MSEETYTFEQAHARLEEIAKQAKGASLEKCLDLLEEGVRLANVCTERIDHTRWRDVADEDAQEQAAEGETSQDRTPAVDIKDTGADSDDAPVEDADEDSEGDEAEDASDGAGSDEGEKAQDDVASEPDDEDDQDE